MSDGWVFAASPCLRCRRVFTYNPHKVPSMRVTFKDGIPIADPDGDREPICETCHGIINDARKAAGLEPWPDPLPGAYEPLPEEEL